MDVQVQVAGQITSKPTNNGGQKFDIPLSNGTKPSTFDAALATRISQFGGAVFTARLEQKGKYLNILDAAGPGEALPPDFSAGAPIGAQIGGQQATPFVVGGAAPTPIVAAPAGGGGGGWDDATTTRVSKLSVYGHATAAVASLFQGAGPEAFEDMVEKIHDLAKRIYISARSHEPGAVPTGNQQLADPAVEVSGLPAPDPAAVAAFVAAQAAAGSPLVQVGTDGVGAAAPAADLPWGQ